MLISSEKTNINIQSRYKPSLDEFISLCELNYSLIVKLLPFLSVKKNNDVKQVKSSLATQDRIKVKKVNQPVHFNSEKGLLVTFKVVEKAVYTTTIAFQLNGLLHFIDLANSNKMNVKLMLRVYHDAKLLEVMDESGYKALKATIKGEYLSFQQVDEKRQLNRFLTDSLKYCLKLLSSQKELNH